MRKGHRRTLSQAERTEKEVQLRETSTHLVGYLGELEHREISQAEISTICTCVEYFLSDAAVASTPDQEHLSSFVASAVHIVIEALRRPAALDGGQAISGAEPWPVKPLSILLDGDGPLFRVLPKLHDGARPPHPCLWPP
jgi:hypothetical protein